MIDPERVGVAGFSADGYTADPRVRAAFVMALFDVPFGKAGLSQVRRPVYSPCSQKLAEQAPELCKDPSGVDRMTVHRQIDADALAFFRKSLGP